MEQVRGKLTDKQAVALRQAVDWGAASAMNAGFQRKQAPKRPHLTHNHTYRAGGSRELPFDHADFTILQGRSRRYLWAPLSSVCQNRVQHFPSVARRSAGRTPSPSTGCPRHARAIKQLWWGAQEGWDDELDDLFTAPPGTDAERSGGPSSSGRNCHTTFAELTLRCAVTIGPCGVAPAVLRPVREPGLVLALPYDCSRQWICTPICEPMVHTGLAPPRPGGETSRHGGLSPRS